jgi:chaperone modulatory protein CbpM
MEYVIMMQIIEVQAPDFYLSFEELCESANISKQTLFELIDHNILVAPEGTEFQEWQFHITGVMRAKKAARIYRDLEIELSDLALVLNLLEEIEQLKNESVHLKRQLDRFSAY